VNWIWLCTLEGETEGHITTLPLEESRRLSRYRSIIHGLTASRLARLAKADGNVCSPGQPGLV
jgi:hypothetical protein